MNLWMIVALVAAQPTEEEIKTAFTQGKADYQAKLEKLEAAIPKMPPEQQPANVEHLAQLKKAKSVRPKATKENGNIGFLCEANWDSLQFLKSLGKDKSYVLLRGGGLQIPNSAFWPDREVRGILEGFDNSKWKRWEYLEDDFPVFLDRYEGKKPVWKKLDLTPERMKWLERE